MLMCAINIVDTRDCYFLEFLSMDSKTREILQHDLGLWCDIDGCPLIREDVYYGSYSANVGSWGGGEAIDNLSSEVEKSAAGILFAKDRKWYKLSKDSGAKGNYGFLEPVASSIVYHDWEKGNLSLNLTEYFGAVRSLITILREGGDIQKKLQG